MCKIWRVSYFRTRIRPKTHPISPFLIRIHPKPARFYTQTFGAGSFWGVCNMPLHRYTQNLPDFRPKPLARNIWGRMLLHPTRVHQKNCLVSYFRIRIHSKPTQFHTSAHGYAKNAPGFRLKPLARNIWGRMQYAPTRVHEKFDGFHIPAPEYVKNTPGFRPKPSSQDIWGRMQYAPTRIHEKPGGF